MYEDTDINQRPPFGQFPPGGSSRPPFFPGFPGGSTPPPFFPGGGGMGESARPYGPPPSRIPRRPTDSGGPGVFRVDPGAIRPCRYQYIYIWLTSGRSYWAWLTFVGRNSVAGYRWNEFTWVYFGTDIDNIDTFVCY